MAGLVRQRNDLLGEGLKIPYWTNWDDMHTDPHEINTRYIELNYWVQSYGQDDEGMVITPIGLFYSIDLEYTEVEEASTERCDNCDTPLTPAESHRAYDDVAKLCGDCINASKHEE